MRQDAALAPIAAAAAGPTARVRRGDRRLLLLVPALAILSGLLIAPLCIMLVYSFLVPGTFGGVIWEFSLGAYVQFLFERDIFDDTLTFTTAYLGIFGRSFAQALVATIGCLLIGLPTAYFMATRPPAQRNLWVFLITVPYWVNLLIRTLAMLFLIRDEGPLNAFLLWLGVIERPLTIAYTISRSRSG
jgi:spermidine/putrescine transport system permease protein